MKAVPQCKTCRREGKKLFLKSDLCNSGKCALLKRKYPPGMHGPKGYPRLSDYGRQLREKQYFKRVYNISEKQLKNYFIKAKKIKGNTEQSFLKFLEKRLDNIVFRAGFFSSRRKARQTVSHGNILINNRRVDIPSYQIKIGDIIQPRAKESIVEDIKKQVSSQKPDILPSWLSLDKKTLQIKILKDLDAEDLPKEFEMELIIGFYSR
jgi:small subunit ribosomal protein S4